MEKRGCHTAYLVAVTQDRHVVKIYVAMAFTADDALAIVAGSLTEIARVELAGALSRNTARRLHLKPGDVRPL
jgi:hypothetical protein